LLPPAFMRGVFFRPLSAMFLPQVQTARGQYAEMVVVWRGVPGDGRAGRRRGGAASVGQTDGASAGRGGGRHSRRPVAAVAAARAAPRDGLSDPDVGARGPGAPGRLAGGVYAGW